MKVIFKNFFRNTMVNLSALSVRHFIPHAEVYCFSYYKHTEEDYKEQEPLYDWISNTYIKTKYVGKSLVYDGEITNGYANPENGCYFTEGFNFIVNHFSHLNEKILILAEDHFFTTGATLREILNTEFTLCYANSYTHELDANASIIALNPTEVIKFFPLPEIPHSIEALLRMHLISKIPSNRLHKLTTRKWVSELPDYMGDGVYTNNSAVIRQELQTAGII